MNEPYRPEEKRHPILKIVLMFVVSCVVLIGLLVAFSSFDSKKQNSFGRISSEALAKGPENAPIYIVEFSDLQCPFCAQAKPVLDEMLRIYGDRIRFEYRHFPLYQIHQRAVPAAVASECAHEQKKFWEFHDIIFQRQKAMEDKDFLKYAREIGLNVDQFWTCYSSRKHLDIVNADYNAGVVLGVRSTPTFFVNGKKFEGALDLTEWKRIFSRL